MTSTVALYRNAFDRIARPGRYYPPSIKGAPKSPEDRALYREATYVPTASVVVMGLFTGALPTAAEMFPRCYISLIIAFLFGVAIVVYREVRRRPFIVPARTSGPQSLTTSPVH